MIELLFIVEIWWVFEDVFEFSKLISNVFVSLILVEVIVFESLVIGEGLLKEFVFVILISELWEGEILTVVVEVFVEVFSLLLVWELDGFFREVVGFIMLGWRIFFSLFILFIVCNFISLNGVDVLFLKFVKLNEFFFFFLKLLFFLCFNLGVIIGWRILFSKFEKIIFWLGGVFEEEFFRWVLGEDCIFVFVEVFKVFVCNCT